MGQYIVEIMVPILVSIIASSGFWLAVMKRIEKKGLQTQLLIALTHDRITSLGLFYISRGWISQDEYENLNEFLFKPYSELGGNGTARRIMQEVDKIEIRTTTHFEKQTDNKGDNKNDTVKQAI